MHLRYRDAVHLLRAMLAHELQQQKGLVNVTPVLFSVLQASCKHPHDLLVVINVIRGLCDLCIENVKLTELA